jgi:hypothetical protein
MRSAVTGALDRARRNRRPRLAEIDWHRTIRSNLRHWQPELRTVVPQELVGYGRKARKPQREVLLCIDQSGSMAASVVYSSIFGAVMASLPAVSTRLVVFDTEVVDMSEQLDDPVDLLFGVQLGGGTDIHRAVSYCQGLIREPHGAILVLISDLYEGGVEDKLLARGKRFAGPMQARGIDLEEALTQLRQHLSVDAVVDVRADLGGERHGVLLSGQRRRIRECGARKCASLSPARGGT